MATLSTTKVAYHGGTADNNSAYVGTSYNGNSQEVCTTRFKFTTDGSGATNITFKTGKALCDVAGAGDTSYDGIALIRFAVTTSDTQYKTYKGNNGYGYPNNLSYSASGNGYIKGTLAINLMPNTDYYLWVFPGSSYPGWTRHQLSSCTVTTSGVYGVASTITADDGVMGSAIPITLTNPISGTTNSLSVTCGGVTESLTMDAGGMSATWTPAIATYAPKITDGLTISATITCTTIVSGITKTSTKTINVSVPDSVVPSIDTVQTTITPDNTDPVLAGKGFTCFVQNYSKATVAVDADGAYGSSITDYAITINNATVHGSSSTQTSGALMTAGTVTVTITVTDSRGRTAIEDMTITVEPYAAPYINSNTLNVFRCDSGGIANPAGTYLYVFAQGVISSLHSQNSIQSMRVGWQVAGGTFIDKQAITSGTPAIISGLNADVTYTVTLSISDELMAGTPKTLTITGQNWGIKFTVANSKVSACGIGKAPESANVLELPSTWGIKRGLARALFSDDFVDFIYPVGSIYISTASTNPGTLFGGTWQRIEDTFLLAAGTSYAAGSTGGEASHTLTVEEIPGHTHTVPYNLEAWRGSGGNIRNPVTNGSGGSVTSDSTGGGQAHNNMPPYLAVYVWERTA